MAKITPISIVQGISGKVCQHDDTYFATNKQTGKVYAAKLCNPSTAEPSAKQLAIRKTFGEHAKIAAAWIKANKPTESNPKGTEAYQLMLQGYKAQHKVGNITGYVRQHIDKDGKVTFGGTLPSTPSGGNDVTEG